MDFGYINKDTWISNFWSWGRNEIKNWSRRVQPSINLIVITSSDSIYLTNNRTTVYHQKDQFFSHFSVVTMVKYSCWIFLKSFWEDKNFETLVSLVHINLWQFYGYIIRQIYSFEDISFLEVCKIWYILEWIYSFLDISVA